MAEDPDRPVVFTTTPTEAEAAVIAAILNGQDVPAQVSGGLTSGFRAEAPGLARVLVRSADVERAREILDAHHPDDDENDAPNGGRNPASGESRGQSEGGGAP